MIINLTDEQAQELGHTVIRALGLRTKKNGRVDMLGGDKTPTGLGHTLVRYVHEVKYPPLKEPEGSVRAAIYDIGHGAHGNLLARYDLWQDGELIRPGRNYTRRTPMGFGPDGSVVIQRDLANRLGGRWGVHDYRDAGNGTVYVIFVRVEEGGK